MAEVNLWSGLRQFTDGELVVKVEANTVGKMLDELISIHPKLEPIICLLYTSPSPRVLSTSRMPSSA